MRGWSPAQVDSLHYLIEDGAGGWNDDLVQ